MRPGLVVVGLAALIGALLVGELALAQRHHVLPRPEPTQPTPAPGGETSVEPDSPLLARVASWSSAWEGACDDMDAYMAHYAPGFRAGYAHVDYRRGVDREVWREQKQWICENRAPTATSVEVSKVVVDGTKTEFCMHFTSVRRKGDDVDSWAWKTLVWSSPSDRATITFEDESELAPRPGCPDGRPTGG